jgi:hypothetical protein
MAKSFSDILLDVSQSKALARPDTWHAMWVRQDYTAQHKHPVVMGHVFKLNQTLLKHATEACRTGDREKFDALRDASKYKTVMDLFNRQVRPASWGGDESHLMALLPELFIQLLNNQPRGVLNLKAWVEDSGLFTAERLAKPWEFGGSTHRQNAWLDLAPEDRPQKTTLSPEVGLKCLCQMSPDAERVGNQLFPDVHLEDIPWVVALGEVGTFYRAAQGASRRLERIVWRLCQQGSSPTSEKQQWVGWLSGYTPEWPESLLKKVWGYMPHACTPEGAMTFVQNEIQSNWGFENQKTLQGTYVLSHLELALKHGRWDFEKRGEPTWLHLNPGKQALMEEAQSHLWRAIMRQKHASLGLDQTIKPAL